jgi:glycosyltransferase involved in cell wall biosynthesis
MHLRTGRNVSPEILQKYNVLLNHKVVKVDSCGIEDVYDMEIVKYHNFAIGFSDKSGVFVHNCIDHDEIPEQRLIRDIQKIINDPNPEIKLIVFKICHLWNDEYHYRTDGLWGGFLQGRLFKNECDQEIEDKENTGFHCGSHPHIPSENMKIVPYRIKHYGNINAAIRMKKYLFYTTNDKVKDVNAILGGWKVWYANLYKCLDEIAAKKGKDFRLEKYELKDSDYYRHIVNEATLKRVEFKEGIILSLPMIVKDEEASIRKALESVKDFVDEIIIVDTGSKDKTLEIAKEYTDKIYHHDWKDNFSEARNYALSLCQGDYILRLDADEILPDGREILWHAIFNQEADLIMFSIHNYMLDPKTNNNAPYTLSKTVRMFRNISGIKYGGRIHEEIDESVNELSKTSHITMSNSRIPILHYGYLRGKEDLKKKHEYYAELAKLDMKDDPKNFKPYFNLATHYYHTENFEEAEKMYRKSLELNPKQWMAWHDLGVLIYKNALRKIDSELGEAKSYFDKSKENMPELVDEQYVQRMNVNLKHVEGLIDGISSKCNNLESIK